MAICPQCHSPTPTGVCDRCSGMSSGMAVALATRLPDPMVEPIHTPPTAPPDSKPLSEQSALAALLRGTPSVAVATPAPTIDWFAAGPATAFPSCGGVVLTGSPVGSSRTADPTVPQTVPATDPADVALTPPPPHLPTQPKLVVLRGVRVNVEFPIYEGRNSVGRFADKPVDIDLVHQEPVEQVWCSRRHAIITFEKGLVFVEDLNSLNGTWVNGVRIHTGQRRLLKHGDVLQIGTVQLRVVLD